MSLSDPITHIIIKDTKWKSVKLQGQKLYFLKQISCRASQPTKGTIKDLITIGEIKMKIKIITFLLFLTPHSRRMNFIMFIYGKPSHHAPLCKHCVARRNDNYPKPRLTCKKVLMSNVSKWVVDFRGYLTHQCEQKFAYLLHSCWDGKKTCLSCSFLD